jgi:hypothetical protein
VSVCLGSRVGAVGCIPQLNTRASRTVRSPEGKYRGACKYPLGVYDKEIQMLKNTFIRHYIEMVVVMFVGMVVLGLPAEAGLQAVGSATSELKETAPAVVFLGMGAAMTIPMVAWMRFRGHRWQPTLEMAASMVIPTLVAIALLAAGVAGFGALMGLEHVAMLLGMLVAMLLRVDEYAGHHHHHGEPVAA